MEIRDQVFIVTGGASGLGAGTARALAESGGKVVIADLNEAAGNALAQELGGRFVRCDVQTVCLGQAASAAAVLLAAGSRGKRAALPNSRVLIHQPATSGTQGQVSDLEIQAAEIERMRKLMETTLSEHTGRTAEQIRIDTDRDKILTAQEAVEYGIIDTVFDYRKLNA